MGLDKYADNFDFYIIFVAQLEFFHRQTNAQEHPFHKDYRNVYVTGFVNLKHSDGIKCFSSLASSFK